MKILAVLNASNNSFMGQIPSSFCISMPYLAVLELSYNQFSGRIPPGIGNCSMLKYLNAGYNHLSGALPDEHFNITLLEHLSFPNNNLEGSLCGISKLINLITLDFRGNELHGNIPDSIGELKRLEEIHLDENNMSGELHKPQKHQSRKQQVQWRAYQGQLLHAAQSNNFGPCMEQLFGNNSRKHLFMQQANCTAARGK